MLSNKRIPLFYIISGLLFYAALNILNVEQWGVVEI